MGAERIVRYLAEIRPLKARQTVVYITSKFKQEKEQEHRENYNSRMLLFIAQPTRAHPEYLPEYEPIYGNKSGKFRSKKHEEYNVDDIIDMFKNKSKLA